MECQCEDCYVLSLVERAVEAVECIAVAAGFGLILYGLRGLRNGDS